MSIKVRNLATANNSKCSCLRCFVLTLQRYDKLWLFEIASSFIQSSEYSIK